MTRNGAVQGQEAAETVLWQLDSTRKVWDFEQVSEVPSDGSDWFFIVNFPRSGGAVAAELLNAHPDIYCGNEQQILPFFMTILGSELFFAPQRWQSVRYSKQIDITALNMRHLLDGWRKCLSAKPIFGDKGEMYYRNFGPACEAAFPGCKFVLTVRHPLDTLASVINQSWGAYLLMDGIGLPFFLTLRQKALEMLALNARWRERAVVIEFDRLRTQEEFANGYRRVFSHLGADPDRYDWEAAWKSWHPAAPGRWHDDERLTAFVSWLGTEDPGTLALLDRGQYYSL